MGNGLCGIVSAEFEGTVGTPPVCQRLLERVGNVEINIPGIMGRSSSAWEWPSRNDGGKEAPTGAVNPACSPAEQPSPCCCRASGMWNQQSPSWLCPPWLCDHRCCLRNVPGSFHQLLLSAAPLAGGKIEKKNKNKIISAGGKYAAACGDGAAGFGMLVAFKIWEKGWEKGREKGSVLSCASPALPRWQPEVRTPFPAAGRAQLEGGRISARSSRHDAALFHEVF